jgi:cytoskeletal protein CcmA (bactofilin family)
MSLLKRRKTASPAPSSSAGGGYSLLDSQLTVAGDLDTAGSLRIDGRLEGNVRRADVVVLGVGATMAGDIHAREVIVGGTIAGNVQATERVELQATAIVTGDITTGSVLVQEGGVVNGRVIMRPPEPVTAGSSRKEESAAGKPAKG